jgi:hypothetical protein
MKTVKIILIILITLIILTGTGFFLIGYFSPKPSGIRIETTPRATVFVDGNLVGETPYEGSYKARKIFLRLVPEGSSENLIPYETSINLTSGVQTVVGRNFANTEADSSGYVVSFEKSSSQDSGILAVSLPNNAQVLIDGVSRGFSPYEISSIAPAMHVITIKSPEYSDFSITVKTLVGYKLTLYAKLGKSELDNSNTNNEPLESNNKTVEILDTPTGYLRVRSEPGEKGNEIAQIKSGEIFPYLSTDVATGWIEIQYEESKPGFPSGIVGWISNDYATVSSKPKQP